MTFAGKVWRLLVGVKDALVLIFMLLFFMALFAVLTTRPSPGLVRSEGALLLELDGVVVEQPSQPDPLQSLISGTTPIKEYGVHDLSRAITAAADDDRVNAVVLDLSRFMGGGHVHMAQLGEALDRVRQADKPVLTYAMAYTDDGVMLAAHASEVWLDPLGGAFVAGPGGQNLYYDGLLDQLNVRARVYRVGTYKSAVEPYTRSDMSPEARENYQQLFDAVWEEYQANVKRARPQAKIAQITTDPIGWIEGANKNLGRAALNAGLVDKLGSRAAFGDRVAEIAGKDDWDKEPGAFAATDYEAWLAENEAPSDGKAIGIVTIAGEIVDGEGGPDTAGGERIAELLDDALDDDLAGLVVRVDSPGGSVFASEEIRRAIMRHKAKGTPVAVSMANLAASGGYWVSTPADRIFAEPETLTGSIGIFTVIPTFEDALAEWGVNSDGVRTTPLSGQPDFLGGFTPEVDALIQAGTEDGYRRFIELVSKSRKMTTARVDEIGQGRVWTGGTARQINLVDQFGDLDAALAWVAGEAGLNEGGWHGKFLGSPVDPYASLLQKMTGQEAAKAPRATDMASLVAIRQAQMGARLTDDLDRLLTTRGMQVYCLECPAQPKPVALPERGSGWTHILARLLQ
ncbi:signal peptide peptidase SppA [Altererythrobacter sp. CAU 1778]